MEQQQRSLVFTAAVGLIILAIIVGSIYYLVKFIQGRVVSNSQSPQASVAQITEDFAVGSPVPQAQVPQGQIPQTPSTMGSTSSPQGSGQVGSNSASDKKVYNGGDFQAIYPKNWGLLKCTNSKNIEFDPVSPADASMECEIAAKPVTVLVGDIRGCEGQASKVGNVDVVKVQEMLNGDTYYLWCTKTTPVLNITHRVSPQNKRGFSTQDFSKQVEEIIGRLSFAK